jgi:hypothetical protein
MHRAYLFALLVFLFACSEKKLREKKQTPGQADATLNAKTLKNDTVNNPSPPETAEDLPFASITLFGDDDKDSQRADKSTLTYELHGNKHEEIWFFDSGGKNTGDEEIQLIPGETNNENEFILRDNLGDEKGTLTIDAMREEEGFDFPSAVTIVFKTGQTIKFTE